MNKFDQFFFSKYLPEWERILDVAHKHFIVIIDKIIFNYFFWVILPTFLFYNSELLQSFIPFFVLEIFIIIVFFKNIYDIFDWYNDVWIITNEWIVDLDWKLFSSNSVSIKYTNIEWLELVETWFIDTILWKWDIIIHKVWGWEKFLLPNANKAFWTLEIIDKEQKKFKSHEHEEHEDDFKEQNFETVLRALSGVVEDYLWKSWYKKDDSEERQELIKKVKKQWWAIDLSE